MMEIDKPQHSSRKSKIALIVFWSIAMACCTLEDSDQFKQLKTQDVDFLQHNALWKEFLWLRSVFGTFNPGTAPPHSTATSPSCIPLPLSSYPLLPLGCWVRAVDCVQTGAFGPPGPEVPPQVWDPRGVVCRQGGNAAGQRLQAMPP